MTDLVAIPTTGEALDLHAPDDELAAWFDQIRDLESQLREVRARISEELISRMDSNASWTLHAGKYKVTAPSPEAKETWDVHALMAVLIELVNEGKVGAGAAQKAVKTEVVRKPVMAGVKAVRKVLAPEDQARLDECRELVPPNRAVRVEFGR